MWRLASPRPETPYFLIESYNGGGNEFGCNGAAANAASVAIDKFIQDNGVAAGHALTGPTDRGRRLAPECQKTHRK